VPFTVQIPPDERDPQLAEKLQEEWPAILRWMLDGCAEWQAIGLAPPAIITEATNAYFDDQDLIQQWIDDRMEDGGPFAFTPLSELFMSWKTWCDERGLKPGNGAALSDAIVDKGFTRKRGAKGVRGFVGLTARAAGT
jgi:phage/plasmid-associated DNA primase